MRRPRALSAGTAGLALLVLMVSAGGGTAATPGGDPHYFEASVLSTGSATADFGEDRLRPGQITASGVDGVESLQWRWEVRAVAFSVGAGPLVTRAKTGRLRAVFGVSIVSYGIQKGILGETQLCEQAAGTTTYLTDDGAGRAAKKSGSGEFVHNPYFGLSEGELRVEAPGDTVHACIHNPLGHEGLGYVEGIESDEARVPRGAFNPRSDRSYERTYRPDPVSHDRSFGSDPNSAHTFTAQSQLEVKFEAISERRFDKLVRKYQNIPVHPRGSSGETTYHDPPG